MGLVVRVPPFWGWLRGKPIGTDCGAAHILFCGSHVDARLASRWKTWTPCGRRVLSPDEG